MATPPKKISHFVRFVSENSFYCIVLKIPRTKIIPLIQNIFVDSCNYIKKFTQLSFQHLNYTLSKRAKIEKYKLTIFHANFNGGKKIFYLSASYFGGKENEKPD